MLLIFLLGFCFGAWGISLLDNVFTMFSTWFQQIQSCITVKVAENQAKITEITGDTDLKSAVSAIGFTIPQEGEECEDD